MEMDTATMRILALMEHEREDGEAVMGASPMTSGGFDCVDPPADLAPYRG